VLTLVEARPGFLVRRDLARVIEVIVGRVKKREVSSVPVKEFF
jgi:hypothetical protein